MKTLARDQVLALSNQHILSLSIESDLEHPIINRSTMRNITVNRKLTINGNKYMSPMVCTDVPLGRNRNNNQKDESKGKGGSLQDKLCPSIGGRLFGRY